MTAPATQELQQTAVPKSKGMSKSEFELLLEKDIKTSVWIEPYGSQPGEEIKLSVPLIRRYIAVSAWDRETSAEIPPSDEECVKFLMLCNARRLNPFEGDAYMIPFWDGGKRRHSWSLITAHSAFLKRAELHPYYDGMQSGVIVERDGKVLELEGDFRLDSDKLLGGWSIVHHKNKTHPTVRRVRLNTYKKAFGVWLNDPEGMICKVAEAQAIRDSFPTLVGGMYLREEMESGQEFQRLVNQDVKRPEFNQGPPDQTTPPSFVQDVKASIEKKRGRKTLVEEPLDQPKPVEQTEQAQQPQAPVATPQADPSPKQPAPTPTVNPAEMKVEDLIAKHAADNGIALAQLIGWMKHKDNRWMKSDQAKLTEVATLKLKTFLEMWQRTPELTDRIKKFSV